MASPMLRKLVKSSIVLKKQIGVLAVPFVRNHWNKDWKPGPYPKTAEERAAAAKKYNLIPEDYEPYPDDGQGFGDYPKLPVITADNRDPLYSYDEPTFRRDFGEPLHIEYDMYGEDRVSEIKYLMSIKQMAWTYLSVMGAAFLIYYIFENFRYEPRILPKQYYNDGKPHYTFDPVD